jgi:murein L,D-transpeptidase YafK
MRSLAGRVFVVALLCSCAAAAFGVTNAEKADRIVVAKAARKLSLYRGDRLLKTYRVALGRQPAGAKHCQGDNRTPEGIYRIAGRNGGSHYHRSLRVSYPNDEDRRAARELGCQPGGDIMIHGLPNGYGWMGKLHTQYDWTLGCIAVSDEEIDEIWTLVPNGTRVEIRP